MRLSFYKQKQQHTNKQTNKQTQPPKKKKEKEEGTFTCKDTYYLQRLEFTKDV